MAEETLNRNIAECLGWTCRTVQTCIAKPERRQASPMDRTTPWKESEQWFPPGKSYSLPLPRYDTDRAACLDLLEHVLRQTVSNPVNPEQQEQFSVTDCSLGTDAWYFELCMESYNGYTRKQCVGEAIVLQRAMALACYEALCWLKEQTP